MTIDNGSCVYAQEPCEICESGVILNNDFDGDGICNIDDNDDDNDDAEVRYGSYDGHYEEFCKTVVDGQATGYMIEIGRAHV